MPDIPGAASGFNGWLLTLTTLALAFALVGLIRKYALRSGMLDHPGERSSHSRATPTGGGAGLVGALVIVSLVPSPWWPFSTAWSWVIVGMVVLAFVGWLDDRRDVSWLARLAVQLLVSIVLLTCLTLTTTVTAQGAPVMTGWGIVIGVAGLVWLMNAWNFMDGSDGMAGAQGVFCGAVLAGLLLSSGQQVAGLAALALAAACLGFLAWNLPPARIFMGDTGSVPLGLAVGVLLWSAITDGVLTLPVALLVPATFMVDAGMTLLWRVVRGERWYTAHRNHLYQRLIGHGWSHGRVLLLYQGVNVLFLAPAIIYTKNNPDVAWPCAGICVMLMMLAWAVSTARLGGVRE